MLCLLRTIAGIGQCADLRQQVELQEIGMQLNDYQGSATIHISGNGRQKRTFPILWSRRFNVDSMCHRRVKVYVYSNLTLCQYPPVIIASTLSSLHAYLLTFPKTQDPSKCRIQLHSRPFLFSTAVQAVPSHNRRQLAPTGHARPSQIYRLLRSTTGSPPGCRSILQLNNDILRRLNTH